MSIANLHTLQALKKDAVSTGAMGESGGLMKPEQNTRADRLQNMRRKLRKPVLLASKSVSELGKTGTSEGARRGWESRKGGAGGLPANPKSLTIDQAAGALKELGITLGNSEADATGVSYAVTHADGSQARMTTGQIKSLLYGKPIGKDEEFEAKHPWADAQQVLNDPDSVKTAKEKLAQKKSGNAA